MKTIALIGCGALSHIFARNLLRILPGEFRITGVMARHAGSAESFADTLDCRFFTEIDPLLALKPDFVIEFAGGAAVRVKRFSGPVPISYPLLSALWPILNSSIR